MDIILITSGIIALAIVAAMPHLEAHEACRPEDEPGDYPDCGQQSAGGQSKPGRAGAEAVLAPLLKEREQ